MIRKIIAWFLLKFTKYCPVEIELWKKKYDPFLSIIPGHYKNDFFDLCTYDGDIGTCKRCIYNKIRETK